MRNLRRGFSLIELLVVIAIIAILAAILFPVFARARASARSAKCQANLKQIGIAIKMYKEDWDAFLPEIDDGNYAGMWTWLDSLEGYVKDRNVFVCPEHKPNPSWSAVQRVSKGWPPMARWTSYAMNTIYGSTTTGWSTRWQQQMGDKGMGYGGLDLDTPLDFTKAVIVAEGSWNWFFADGQDPTETDFNKYEQGITPPNPGGNWCNNMIEYRHPAHLIADGRIVQGGGANFLMGDGHVKHMFYPVDFEYFDPTYNIWKN